MRYSKIILLLLLATAVAVGQQPKSRRAILLHQSTGGNYFGVGTLCETPSTNARLQVPIYNDLKGLAGNDTVSFAEDGIWPAGGEGSGRTSWNNLHHIIDNDAGFTASSAKLWGDTVTYGIISLKTCFSWEAGSQTWTGSWADTSNRESAHNMYTSKWHIMSMVRRMSQMPNIKWVLWTMPAGWQTMTEIAGRTDRQLARWMKDTLAIGRESRYGTFPTNVYIFDIHGLASDAAGKQRLIYSCNDGNSHPNANAIETFSPIIVRETFDWAIYGDYPKHIIHPFPRKASMIWTPTCAGDMSRYDIVMGSHYDTAAVRRARALTDSTYFLVTRDYNQGGIYADAFLRTDVPTYFRVYDTLNVALQYLEAPYAYLGNLSPYSGTHPIRGVSYVQFQADTSVGFYDFDLWDGIHSDGMHHMILPPSGGNIERVDLDRNGHADFYEVGKGRGWIESQWHWGWSNMADAFRIRWLDSGWTYKIVSMWTMGSTSTIVNPSGSIIDTCGVKQWNGEEWENAWNPAENNNIGSQNTFGEWYQKYAAWRDNAGQSPYWRIITIGMNGATGRPSSLGERDWWYARFWTAWGSMTDAYICFHHTYNTGVDHESALYYDEFDIPLGHPTTEAQTLSSGALVRFFQNGAIIFNPACSMTSPYAGSATNRTVTLADISGVSGYAGPYYQVVTGQDTSRSGGLFSSVTLTTHTVGSYQAGDALYLLKWQDTVISDIIIDNASFPTSPGSDAAVLTGFTYDAGASQQSQGTGAVYTNPTYTNVMHFNSGDAAVFSLTQTARQHYAQCARGGTYTAVYTPKIGRAGNYRISAWHGWRGTSDVTYTETDSAKVRIYHLAGDTTVYVNQYNPALRGQWNVLATVYLTPTSNKNLVLSNDGDPTKYVLADAFRWEYLGTGEPPQEPEEPPAIPTLNTPCGTTNISIRPTMYWNPSNYADSYRLQVSAYSNFAVTVVDQSGITNPYYTLTSDLEYNTVYYWRVNATNEYGTSDWSSSCSFTTTSAPTSSQKYLIIKP